MTPADDQSWPDCQEHPTPSGQADHHWCDWTRDWLIAGRDVQDIVPGMRYCVPVVPQFDLYAEVSIGSEQIITDTYQLSLVKSEPFTLNEDFVPLGLWVRGEGRLTMAHILDDWLIIFSQQACPITSHGFNEQRNCDQIAQDDSFLPKKAMLWCLGYHGMCWPCYKKTLNVQSAQSVTVNITGDPSTFGSTEFGINPSDFGTPTRRDVRQDRTRQALQNRFGNRTTAQLDSDMKAGKSPIPLGDNNWNGGSI